MSDDLFDQQLPLRQRLAASARGLACSTLTGVASIEAELTNVGTGGKHALLQDPSPTKALYALDDARGKRRRLVHISSQSASFRTTRNFSSRLDIGSEFEQFCDGSSTIDDRGESTSAVLNSGACSSSPTSHLAAQPDTHDPQQKADDLTVDGDAASGLVSGSVLDRDSSAKQRLDQVQQHLSKSQHPTQVWNPKANSETDIDAGILRETIQRPRFAAGNLLGTSHAPHSSQQAVEQNQAVLLARPSYCKTLPPEQRPNMSMAEHAKAFADNIRAYKRQLDERRRADQAEWKDEDEHLLQCFHCPFTNCHRNLAFPASLGDSLPAGRRYCVHDGCLYATEKRREWLEHNLMPHHDLLVQRPADRDVLTEETSSISNAELNPSADGQLEDSASEFTPNTTSVPALTESRSMPMPLTTPVITTADQIMAGEIAFWPTDNGATVITDPQNMKPRRKPKGNAVEHRTPRSMHWTAEEDAAIRELREQGVRWGPVAKHLGTSRTARECHDRFRSHIRGGGGLEDWADLQERRRQGYPQRHME